MAYKSGYKRVYEPMSDSDSDKEVKKSKRVDFNELFSVKLSPFHKWHCALTNGKGDGDDILFVNIRNGYSAYGAGKGMVLNYDEISHILEKLHYDEPLPKLKGNGTTLKGKPKNGKFDLTRSKNGKAMVVTLPITCLVGLMRILPSIKFLMEKVRLYTNYVEGDRAFDEFILGIQKSVMEYIKEMADGELTKSDFRKMYWIYCGVMALFNLPAFANPFLIDNLPTINQAKVDEPMVIRITEIIDYIILKVFT